MMDDAHASLVARIRGEYLEMPGLHLTVRQAARLWGIERALSELVLATLVASGFLWRTADGAYVRRSAR